GFDLSLAMDQSAPNISLAGYRRTLADAVLGFVFLTPGAGRQPVYRLADPNETGGFFNAHYLPPLSHDYNAARYVVGDAERDRLIAAGLRDDGVAFYVSDAGTRTIDRKWYTDTWEAGPVVYFTDDGDEATARAGDDPTAVRDFGPRFKVLATQEDGSVPL